MSWGLHEKSAGPIPFVVRYLTTNGLSLMDGPLDPFALRYRRGNGSFYKAVIFEAWKISIQ